MRKILSVLVLLFVLAALLPGYTPGAANAQTGEETPTPETGEEMPLPGLGEFPGSEALAALNSYRYRMTISAEGEAMTEESGLTDLLLEGEFTREPQAIRAVISVPEGAEGAEVVEATPCGQARCEYIVVENNGWVYDTETKSWKVEPMGAMVVGFLQPAFFLSILLASWSEEEAKLVNAHEDLGRMDTSHYRWGPKFEDIAAIFGGETPEEMKGGVEELAFDLWLANELGYPAKFSFVLAGKDEEGKSGRAEIVIEIFDVNAPITIVLPEGAEVESPLDIPTPDDAQVLISSADTLMYSTASNVEDMANFYREKLPGQGWTEDKESSFSMEGMASLSFKKDGQTLSILLSADKESGKTSVMASLEKEGVEAPSEAEEVASKLDIPTPDDAQMVFSTADNIVYTTAISIEDMADFYRKQLPNLVWTEDTASSTAMEDMVFMFFKKGEQTLSISIMLEEASGRTQVTAGLVKFEQGE